MAPLALLVALAAVGYVVSSATRDEPGSSSGGSSGSKSSSDGKSSTGAKTTAAEGGKQPTTTSSEAKNYTVKSGDTLGMISEQTGVSIEDLQELNPDLDPQSLTVGDRIRLRR
jgi:teichoic acid transport system ATP-binding protein